MTAVSDPSNGSTGGTITVSASASGGTPPPFIVGIYLSADPVITSSDLFIGSRYVSDLAPGASSAADTVITVPAGTDYLGVLADASNGTLASDDRERKCAL